MELSDLAEELKTDKAKHAEFMETCVHPYEEEKRSGKKRVGKTRKKADVSVENSTTDSLQYAKTLGVPWPVVMYTKRWGQPKSKKDITTHTVGGVKVSGVVMDSKQGNPDSTYLITSKSTSNTKMAMSRSSADDVENKTEEMHQKAQKRMRVDPRSSGKGACETHWFS